MINKNFHLENKEKLILVISPNPWEFLMEYLIGGILVFLYGIGVIVILITELVRRKTKYYITNKKIIYEYTFLANNVSNVEYSKIQDLHLRQNFIEKMFDIGVIELNTSGSNKTEIKIKGVKNPSEIKTLIEKHIYKRH